VGCVREEPLARLAPLPVSEEPRLGEGPQTSTLARLPESQPSLASGQSQQPALDAALIPRCVQLPRNQGERARVYDSKQLAAGPARSPRAYVGRSLGPEAGSRLGRAWTRRDLAKGTGSGLERERTGRPSCPTLCELWELTCSSHHATSPALSRPSAPPARAAPPTAR